MNVASFLQNQALSNPDSIALSVPKKRLSTLLPLRYTHYSFKKLNHITDSLAYKLQSQGITPQSRVLMLLNPGLPLILASFALFKIGAIPIIIDPGMGIKNFLKCTHRSQPHALLANSLPFLLSNILPSQFPPSILKLNFNSLFNPNPAPSSPFPIYSPKNSDLAAIAFTSGSTGPAKGVPYSHSILFHQLQLLQKHFSMQPGESDLPMLPIFALFNPSLGIRTVVPEINPSKPASVNPKKIVQAILSQNISSSFGSPTIWKKVALYCNDHHLSLPSLKRILMAGCAVPPNLVQAYQSIAPNATIFTPYGATEALPLTAFSSHTLLPNLPFFSSQYATCVGSPLPEVQLQIIPISHDPLSSLPTPLPSNSIGEIIVSGPHTTTSYDNLPDATLKSKIITPSTTWHRMGDAGFLDPSGNLWFCGRIAEIVHSPSGPLYTELFEKPLRSHPKVHHVALIALSPPKPTISLLSDPPPTSIPAIVIQPTTWPSSHIAQKKLLSDIQSFASKFPHLQQIPHFFLFKKFPLDPRHNAKIHRLKLSSIFSHKFFPHPTP